MFQHKQDNDTFLDTRRGFLKFAIGALSLLGGLVLGIPYMRTILRSSPPGRLNWVAVGPVDSLPEKKPVNLRFAMRSQDAYLHGEISRSVWVIKDSTGSLTVFSPSCPHLGCHYTWNKKTNDFECPCHGSVFTLQGAVVGGPSPRPLDTLPHKIDGGTLFVEWKEFKVGIPEKIRV
jgi:menaquinol-cytochrome c reductase iron-sulfur subunit